MRMLARQGLAPALAVVAAATVFVGCGLFLPKTEEFRSERVAGSYFDSISVISANDDQGILQATARVRDKLEKEGVHVVHVKGLWQTETQAIEGICSDYHVSGVVVVDWNRMTLRDCERKTVAFDVKGGYSGVDQMGDRLLNYLRTK